ncbi:cellobiose dehydrogenase [Xylaria nigripes]|nr:cellobiose dehydrogenase [Xylaria nigripes]
MKSSVRWLTLFALLHSLSLAAPFEQEQQVPITTDDDDWTSHEWDAIVVGAGTAGIIVADRLSEAGKRTLLLEIGGPSYGITGGRERPKWLQGTQLSRVDVPGLYKSVFSGSESLLCPPGVVNSYQACTIGGNSAINAGLYFQPPASDWDDYHPAGWKSNDVKAATDRLLDTQSSVTSYSGDGKFYLQSGYEVAKEWFVDEAGFRNVSFNDEPDDKDGVFGRPSFMYIGGERGGPVRTYLQRALRREDFTLRTGVRVWRVLHDSGVASGVLATVDGVNVTISLASEGRVILSTGAIASPGLLMNSGIGPLDILTTLPKSGPDRSTFVVNDAVGVGLFDNPNTFIELYGPTVESYEYSYENPLPEDRDLYLYNRSGPYTFASQTSVVWGYVSNPDGTRTAVQGTIDSAGYGDYKGNHTITMNVYGTSGLLSSGRVILADDLVPTPNGGIYYAYKQDGMNIAKFIHTIFQNLPDSTPEKPAKEGFTPLNLPRRSTLEEIYSYITTWSPYAVGSVQHWSSSCRIEECVDADTKVIGTENIHVVDASIVAPLTVNPMFGIMVAAEKGSERILATW